MGVAPGLLVREAMKAHRWIPALALAFSAAIGCSSGASTGTGGDGGADGNPGGCPAALPTAGADCSPSGLQCTYRCSEEASCNGGQGTLVGLGISCLDSGAPMDGSSACHKNSDCTAGYECSP